VLDWSIIDAQVASSMRDVDEDSDDELTADDENDLLVSILACMLFISIVFEVSLDNTDLQNLITRTTNLEKFVRTTTESNGHYKNCRD